MESIKLDQYCPSSRESGLLDACRVRYSTVTIYTCIKYISRKREGTTIEMTPKRDEGRTKKKKKKCRTKKDVNEEVEESYAAGSYICGV